MMKKDPVLQRPVRFELHKDDVLIYIHIPKTGGLSLTAILDSQFPDKRIFPIHSPIPMEKLEHLNFSSYRLVRGHFQHGPYSRLLYKHISRNPVLITLLREPISRVVSAYRFLIQQNKLDAAVDFETFITDPQYKARAVNAQLNFVVGAIDGLNKKPGSLQLSDDALLYLAQERLQFMPWFGLTERYSESIKLLCYTFGWPIIKEPPVINKTHQKFNDEILTPHVMEILKEKLRAEIALYHFAQTLFEERYREMTDELLVREFVLQQQYKKPLDYQKYLRPTPEATVLPPLPFNAETGEMNEQSRLPLKLSRFVRILKKARHESFWRILILKFKRIRQNNSQVKRI
jgi:hypothetical protein